MRHWAPVTRIYNIALITWRISRLRGRPPVLATGIKSMIQSHWRLVRSVGDVCVLIPHVYLTLRPDRHPFQTASATALECAHSSAVGCDRNGGADASRPFFHDGTERPITRPHDDAEQSACYSGKKK